MLRGVVCRTLILVVIIFTSVTENIASDLPSSHSQSYSVTTLINAKWQLTPLYLEISEYLADENPALFWDYVNEIMTQQKPIKEYGKISFELYYSISYTYFLLL